MKSDIASALTRTGENARAPGGSQDVDDFLFFLHNDGQFSGFGTKYLAEDVLGNEFSLHSQGTGHGERAVVVQGGYCHT